MGGYDKYVRQLKLSLLLPLMQLFLAVGLWDGHRTATPRVLDTFYWPTSVLICYGINAPALVLKLLAFPFTRGDQVTPPSISGYGLEELFFFLGVGILWFYVGKLLQRASERAPSAKHFGLRQALANLFFIALGVALLIEGIQGLRTPGKWNNYWGNIAESVLFLVWSLILLAFPGLQVAKGIRWRTPETQSH
jgi:hypothetical protein